jgi:saccharopine dehydrogenase-like NADP-dependent oxidoreductase
MYELFREIRVMTDKTNIAIIGAGKIGEAIASLLLESADYRVTLIDRAQEVLDAIPGHPALAKIRLNVGEDGVLGDCLTDQFAVLSSAPFFLTKTVADAANLAGCHYLDLTEDVASTQYVRQLAGKSKQAFIPQCGLAPGFISIVANDVASAFDQLDTIRMCVGALPQYPSNSLNYNLTWSTDGVINEYCEPCEAIKDGVLMSVPPLEHLEHFSLDGINYETFNTSGGLGSLGETLLGRINNLSYQTIRYPGHRDIMKTLLQDLGLRQHRDLLKNVLENAVPATMQDVVIVFVTVSGQCNGQLLQETYANKIYGSCVNGILRSAIQITTASSICAMMDLLREGRIPCKGFIRQEEIPLALFLGNRFGRVYGHEPLTDRRPL